MNIILENGDIFKSQNLFPDLLCTYKNNLSHGAISEIVFNTTMSGHEEMITDPSYTTQSLVLTAPLVGNYGISYKNLENLTPSIDALIVSEFCEFPSHPQMTQTLKSYLYENQVLALHRVDTRALTEVIRHYGVMKCFFSEEELTREQIKKQFNQSDNSRFTNVIKTISVKKPLSFPNQQAIFRVVMLDFGYKKSILTSLLEKGCEVIIVPWNTTFNDIKKLKPDGILLSNGPGDPESIKEIIPTIQRLQENYPLFAICMGHQIFALANGAKTEKMKFGNRGGNHPVKELSSGKVFITAQNHGYAVSSESVENTELILEQVNLNDQSVEGLGHKKHKAFSVQYHPEAMPGPNDTYQLFDRFLAMIRENNN